MTIGNTPSINSKIELPELNKTAKKENRNQSVEHNIAPAPENNNSGKDTVNVTKMPSGKKEVITNIAIADSTNATANISKKDSSKLVDSHIKEIEKVLQKKNPSLQLKDKEEILNILNTSKSDNTLNDLVKKLDKDKKLVPLYHNMGTLVNQGNAGAATSGILALLTLGGTLVAEAKENRAFEMKKILTESGVGNEILDKLK